MADLNKTLIAAGTFNLFVALLHLVIIFGGAEWYRFFGAGEEMARLAEQGSIYPALITFLITLILLSWALYAFSGAGLIGKLPWLKPALIVITLIYLIRGLGALPLALISPASIDTFIIVTSLISLGAGLLHLSGVRRMTQID
jgi:hypothetical protein